MNPLPNYPGSKGGSGVDKRLVSLMGPHKIYVEAFLGSGRVLDLKRPAALSIGLDISPSVVRAWGPAATPGLTLEYCEAWHAVIAGTGGEDLPCEAKLPRAHTPDLAIAAVPTEARETHPVAPLCVAMVDALEWFASSPAMLQDPLTLLYVDPPYLRSVRTRLFYDFELESPEAHDTLLKLLCSMRCQVMLSHYPCRFYTERLQSWRQVSYRTMTRGGVRIECAWCNFPEPATFHDPRFLGDGFRERERMKRKSKRWRGKFQTMSSSERQVVATELARVDRASFEAALRPGL